MRKVVALSVAMWLVLVVFATPLGAQSVTQSDEERIEPKAVYGASVSFEPYSISPYQKTIVYGEVSNGPIPPSPAYQWFFALLVDGKLAKPRLVATNLPSTPEIFYHADCQVIKGGAWEIVQSGWNFIEPYKYWAKVETYAYNTGTYVAKAGADPEHGGTLWGYFATAYLYVE